MTLPRTRVVPALALGLVLFAGQSHAGLQDGIMNDATMLAEMEAAPVRDVSATDTLPLAPEVAKRLAGGYWWFAGELVEAEHDREPVRTPGVAACATGVQLKDRILAPLDVGGGDCASQAKVWSHGSYQVWKCRESEGEWTASRLIYVQGENLMVLVQDSYLDREGGGLDSVLTLNATTAHGGACSPGPG
jgi:hypothetical protein